MQEQHKYVIVNGEQAPEFAEALFYHKNFKRVESALTAPEDLIAAIRAGEFAVAVVIPEDFQAKQSAVEQSQWQLIYNQSSQLDFMSRYFNELLLTFLSSCK